MQAQAIRVHVRMRKTLSKRCASVFQQTLPLI